MSQEQQPPISPASRSGPNSSDQKSASSEEGPISKAHPVSRRGIETATAPLQRRHRSLVAPSDPPMPPSAQNPANSSSTIHGSGSLSPSAPRRAPSASTPLAPYASQSYATAPASHDFFLPMGTTRTTKFYLAPSHTDTIMSAPQSSFDLAYRSFPALQQQAGMYPPTQPMSTLGGPAYMVPGQAPEMQRPDSGYPVPLDVAPQFNYFHPTNNHGSHSSPYLATSGTQPATSRGPPRKPRQSGHALWVGNLPLGALVVDLKDHFSREATSDIESVKLISKSNCAFVNYRTQAACAAAMSRFHDSRFHGTRLVCRLRKSSIPSSSGMPSSGESMHPHPSPDSPPSGSNSVQGDGGMSKPRPSTDAHLPVRYFILKSLTMQDLESSTRTGIWATQAHNEDALNHAYENANTVYLIFSANKSGEYFGFARMTSSIPAPDADFSSTSVAPPTDAPAPLYGDSGDPGPRSIPTPATEWAPRGKIIDDSARGTIFWEADVEDDGTSAPAQQRPSPLAAAAPSPSNANPPRAEYPLIARSPADPRKASAPAAAPDAAAEPHSRGNPFHVEWQSAKKVPFYRTRGLRNPWNANREVKIARDGTEIEPAVGAKLVALFGGATA